MINIKNIIKKELLREQVACREVSPKGNGKGGYISNEELLKFIDKIEVDGYKDFKNNPKKLQMLKNTLKSFRRDVKNVDTNLDTVDTYLHKLRDLFNCYGLSNNDNTPEDFVY